MPIYEYECRRCGHRFELIQSFSEKPRKRCPECSGAVDRLISPPAIRFKGTGWYVTDYADKKKGTAASDESGGAADAAKPDGEKPGEKPGDKAGDKKPAAKKTEPKKDKKAS